MSTSTRTTSHSRATPAPQPAGGNGASAPRTGLPPRRRVRLPELAIGLLVTGAFALGGMLWHLSATTRVPALAAATAIERGTPIDATNLRVVYVASDAPIQRIDSTDASLLVGQRALVDLDAGTLLTPSVLGDSATLQPGNGIVGLALDPGGYPARGLASGDLVNIVGYGTTTAEGPEAVNAPLARAATVVAVDDLASDRKLVSLLVAENEAEHVAVVAARGDALRLVMVSR